MPNSGIPNNLQSAYNLNFSSKWSFCIFKITFCQLLDLSAAFYTLDHDLFLGRLTGWFGIDGVVLQWVRSYLTGRSQLVKVYGVLSTLQLLSVLGPLLFSIYTTPLSSIITVFTYDELLF